MFGSQFVNVAVRELLFGNTHKDRKKQHSAMRPVALPLCVLSNTHNNKICYIDKSETPPAWVILKLNTLTYAKHDEIRIPSDPMNQWYSCIIWLRWAKLIYITHSPKRPKGKKWKSECCCWWLLRIHIIYFNVLWVRGTRMRPYISWCDWNRRRDFIHVCLQ